MQPLMQPTVKFLMYLLSWVFLGFISNDAYSEKTVLLGIYEGSELTEHATIYNSNTGDKLKKNLALAQPMKKGEVRVYYNIKDWDYDNVVITCLGNKSEAVYNYLENIDMKPEMIRTAIAAGIGKIVEIGSKLTIVDSCGDPKAAAEGATLGLFSSDGFGLKLGRNIITKPGVLTERKVWDFGVLLASAQNLARAWTEAPANVLTPANFADQIQQMFANFSEVTVKIRDSEWIEAQKMYAFLSVSKSSALEPFFVEIHYNNSERNAEAPIILIGKGITFDSGGISPQKPENMDKMIGNKAGAAQVFATIYALAQHKEKINVIVLVPLCENMPGVNASRPGDLVTSLNGKTIQIDGMDADGRLVLADTLAYASIAFKPMAVLSVSTHAGGIETVLGRGAVGVFSTSSVMLSALEQAAVQTGDRVWRMPLFQLYTNKVRNISVADLKNVVGENGGPCIAAAFLKEFVTALHWAHLDVSGVMFNDGEVSYLGRGMSGRPTRTIIEAVPVMLKKLRSNLN